MVNFNDLVKLLVTESDVRKALAQAMKQQFIDNLRSRPKTVQLDCKIRGYLGEIVLKKWFITHNIHFAETNFIIDGADMDIDLVYNKNGMIYNLEVKTSLIPDNYISLKNSLGYCDIKLIKRTNQVENLRGDIHLQIYFDFLRKERDTWLGSKIPKWDDLDNIYDTLELGKYIENTYFVGWIDKPTLIQKINNLPINQRTWTFPSAQKDFWRCNIQRDSKKPNDIVSYIKSLNIMKNYSLIAFISDRYVVGLQGFIYTVLDELNGAEVFVNSASSENYMKQDIVQQGQYYYYSYCGVSRPNITILEPTHHRVIAAMEKGGHEDMTLFRRYTENLTYSGNYPTL